MQNAQAIASSLSRPRLAKYMAAADNDILKALDLYLWNIDVAGAVLSTTAMVEVQLRNAINARLCSWNAAQNFEVDPTRSQPYSQDWLTDPAPKLAQVISPPRREPLWKSAQQAARNIEETYASTNLSHDDLVAGLSFGSWLWLLPRPDVDPSSTKNNRMYLWNECLKYAFKPRPGVPYKTAGHAVIYNWADIVRQARNRAGHLEPLINEHELRRLHRVSCRLLNSLNAPAASWLAGQHYIDNVLERRPF